jgi:hypothetical protein
MLCGAENLSKEIRGIQYVLIEPGIHDGEGIAPDPVLLLFGSAF